ncbi:uncharacterized protein BDR25DRAFT_105396 [Lindgomyces ingoldianus]|uniref:Uncharacterized protein n=1 Tax=Lindgomyces ingoldianus TaxID=673940 RepID=A0ACB6QAH5_9PLEO|nr:uncharacterized protein BDR25DRAFT_105396 [Lindgomyces ingoldianus]KAF2463907.1 hypothetical protein BDR25DRAFT_105396 [Lindgomyces ingoldianus]
MALETGNQPILQFVKRYPTSTNEQTPWTGLTFTLDIGSDIFWEKLKNAYPSITDHKQRKHKAVIEFLEAELQDMKMKERQRAGGTVNVESENLTSPKSFSTDFFDALGNESGPGSASPRSGTSSAASPHQESQPGDLPQSNQNQDVGSGPLPPPTQTSSGQTIVFSAYDGTTVQPKTRKKMTLEERRAYAETRKRGACPRCKQSKGRCTHFEDSANQSYGTCTPKPGMKRKYKGLTQCKLGPKKALKLEETADCLNRALDKPRPDTCPGVAPHNLSDALVVTPSSGDPFTGGPGGVDGAYNVPDKQKPMYVPNQPTSEPFETPIPGDEDSRWPYPSNQDYYDSIYLQDGSSVTRPHSPPSLHQTLDPMMYMPSHLDSQYLNPDR